ncbi:RHS repeat-associated core domain-containing protein [Luteimonas kalidii]|uniref:RHS repeat-associated core domain-containing protein n=1 Tax=Luteimonas kalidii TaxID=3042025 RepID=A0ABT6JNZ5_9GAMM|nr:RHS repeat-associated core domain-containing protein [Luteimonas kalidii]MDH5832406.1 RHS repeat-associated core domain-containing protein [Luteimonas kalidii]
MTARAQTTVKYVHTDALGSVVAMTDASGAVVEGRREYEAYGQQLTPALKDGPGYTGHVQDAATGLTYMQQRYYDPMLGVFLSVDPVTAYGSPTSQFHRYRYANSNPYKFLDPDGRQGATAGELMLDLEYGNQYSNAQAETVTAFFRNLPNTIAGMLLCGGCDPGYVAPPGSGEVTSVGSPFDSALGLRAGFNVAARASERSVRSMISAASLEHKDGLNVAARKLTQHAQRSGYFREPVGSVAQKNIQALSQVRDVVTAPNAVRTSLGRGGFEVRMGRDGAGVRFDRDGSFNTFLDPRKRME